MSNELYDNFAKINYVDQTIYESEQEILNRVEVVDADIVFEKLKKNILDKYRVKIKKKIIKVSTK